MKGSIIVVSFFVLGLLLSRFDLLHEVFYGEDYTRYILYALILCVGINIGSDKTIFKTIKQHGAKIFLLPLSTIVGTLGGCLILGLLWDTRSVTDCLAVGSGFAYYSLSSILITDLRGEELGTIALLSNVIRELITLLFAPAIIMLFGKTALISSGGATSMDTTLAIVTRYCGKDWVVISIFHGFIVDFTVPFLVTFFASM